MKTVTASALTTANLRTHIVAHVYIGYALLLWLDGTATERTIARLFLVGPVGLGVKRVGVNGLGVNEWV